MPNRHPNTKGLVSHRFPKGVSGNPGGMPKIKPFRNAYLKFGAMTLEQLQKLERKKLTMIELAVIGTLKEAIKGRVMAASESADRTDGKVPQAIHLPPVPPLVGEELDDRISELLGQGDGAKAQRRRKA